jgi:hypothetical protein
MENFLLLSDDRRRVLCEEAGRVLGLSADTMPREVQEAPWLGLIPFVPEGCSFRPAT